jgi:glutathione S-transferase
MAEEPIDGRLDAQFHSTAQKDAIDTVMNRFLTDAGREFFALAVKKSEQERVKRILDVMHELTAEGETVGDRLNVFDVAAAAMIMIQASVASSTYRNERKSWEN